MTRRWAGENWRATVTYQAIVGLDFVDAENVRHYTFQVCADDNGRRVALVCMRDEKIIRLAWTNECDGREAAIIRWAKHYRDRRSIPQRFTKAGM